MLKQLCRKVITDNCAGHVYHKFLLLFVFVWNMMSIRVSAWQKEHDDNNSTFQLFNTFWIYQNVYIYKRLSKIHKFLSPFILQWIFFSLFAFLNFIGNTNVKIYLICCYFCFWGVFSGSFVCDFMPQIYGPFCAFQSFWCAMLCRLNSE